MNKLLLAALVLAVGGATNAMAETAYHVGATSDGGPGTGPNIIGSNTSFFIADNPNKAQAGPLNIFFAVPEGEAAPSISKITYNGGTTGLSFIGPLELTSLGDFTAALKTDFYSFVGCTSCNASLNFPNFTDGIVADTTLPAAPTAYDAFKAVVNVNFAGKDFIKVVGSFAEGTYVAPLSGDGVDTSFTNTGLITGDLVINPTGSVPEASTWVMLIGGFGLMAAMGYRRAWTRGRTTLSMG
jgi:hypothetical protein